MNSGWNTKHRKINFSARKLIMLYYWPLHIFLLISRKISSILNIAWKCLSYQCVSRGWETSRFVIGGLARGLFFICNCDKSPNTN